MHLADDEGVTRIFEELIVVAPSCLFEAPFDKCVGSVRPASWVTGVANAEHSNLVC